MQLAHAGTQRLRMNNALRRSRTILLAIALSEAVWSRAAHAGGLPRARRAHRFGVWGRKVRRARPAPPAPRAQRGRRERLACLAVKARQACPARPVPARLGPAARKAPRGHKEQLAWSGIPARWVRWARREGCLEVPRAPTVRSDSKGHLVTRAQARRAHRRVPSARRAIPARQARKERQATPAPRVQWEARAPMV